MTLEALKLLRRIHGAFPEPHPADFDDPALRELRDLDFVDLWDLGPKGESRWTATTEGKAALNRVVPT